MSPEEIEQACRDAEKLTHMAKQIEPHLKPEDRTTILVQALAAERQRIIDEMVTPLMEAGRILVESGKGYVYCTGEVLRGTTEMEDVLAVVSAKLKEING